MGRQLRHKCWLNSSKYFSFNMSKLYRHFLSDWLQYKMNDLCQFKYRYSQYMHIWQFAWVGGFTCGWGWFRYGDCLASAISNRTGPVTETLQHVTNYMWNERIFGIIILLLYVVLRKFQTINIKIYMHIYPINTYMLVL